MQTRRIGGLDVSVIGLGCNQFGRTLDEADSIEVISAAIDAGITHFDSSDTYGLGQSEEYLGKALRGRRDEVVIATKFGKSMGPGLYGSSPAYVRTAVEASLRRLQTDYIDLYWQHEPDADVPLADTLGALAELIQAGKVREVGTSNTTLEEFVAADETPAPAHFAAVQNEYSLLVRAVDRGLLGALADRERSFVPFFPLAVGLLTGKYRVGGEGGARFQKDARLGGSLMTEENLGIVDRLAELAEAHERTLTELAFGWLLSRPAVKSVIAGSSKVAQIRQNASYGDLELDAALLTAIEEIAPVRDLPPTLGLNRTGKG
ncbi:MAG TPA: aldo/keto reductase [Microbacteriaceae bacterium]|nr:aldo/keto reductase [Microbacteriaceae bacterium]